MSQTVASFTFDEFVEAVHHRGPFPWQRRLAAALISGQPPSSISMPTGMGKTSALDAWIWALAIDIERTKDRRGDRMVPLRCAFVVDRRVVVDAAHEHASRIAAALQDPAEAVTAAVAGALRGVGHALVSPLDVVRMRGGVSWSWRWLRQPDQPAAVVGTVDQFGSRLLFRGYGVGRRLRSIDAALVGTDTICFLDEAHLSAPLVQTVRACQQMQSDSTEWPALGSLTVVPMTATPGDGAGGGDPIRPDHEDLQDPEAAKRLGAVKWADLVEVEGKRPTQVVPELAVVMADRAAEAAAAGATVLVVANTIALARSVFTLVEKQPRTWLAIGRAREVDKEATRRQWWNLFAAGRPDRVAPGEGAILVATQTIEVGADLDADVLVTEVASIDALIQRFGRVDRLGDLWKAGAEAAGGVMGADMGGGGLRSSIVHHPLRSGGDADLVYGTASEATWQWLADLSTSGIDGRPQIDFGSLAMLHGLEEANDVTALRAPNPLAPELFQPIIHLLAQTNPEPSISPDVAPYLHGVQRVQASVQVLWRADLPNPGEDIGLVRALLAVAPPTTDEAVEVPIRHLRRMLGWSVRKTQDDLADVEAREASEDDAETAVFGAAGWIVRDASAAGIDLLVPGIPLRPGDLVVLPSSIGGHDQFGWTGTQLPTSEDEAPVADVADLVALSSRHPDGGGSVSPARLRLDPRVLRSLGLPVPAELSIILREVDDLDVAELSGLVASVLLELRDAAPDSVYPESMGDLLAALDQARSWSTDRSSGGWVEVLRSGSTRDGDRAPVIGAVLRASGRTTLAEADDDDDRAGSSRLGAPVVLTAHLDGVGARARAFARGLGLPSELVAAVERAGKVHDLGKVEPRFQVLLRGGDWIAAAAFAGDLGRALAKSGAGPSAITQKLPDEWRWPRGMRHEAVSLALLRCLPAEPGVDDQLVAHLVGSHHGWLRPMFPAVRDPDARSVRTEFENTALVAQVDAEMADLDYAATFRLLCERYGWWGLAALEAIVRLADMAVSEEGS